MSGIVRTKFNRFTEQCTASPGRTEASQAMPQNLPKQILPGLRHSADSAGSRSPDSSRFRRVLNRAAQIAGCLGTAKPVRRIEARIGQLTGAIEGTIRVISSTSADDENGFSSRLDYTGSSAADCAGG
jgi:hypothetical protein